MVPSCGKEVECQWTSGICCLEGWRRGGEAVGSADKNSVFLYTGLIKFPVSSVLIIMVRFSKTWALLTLCESLLYHLGSLGFLTSVLLPKSIHLNTIKIHRGLEFYTEDCSHWLPCVWYCFCFNLIFIWLKKQGYITYFRCFWYKTISLPS